MRQAEGRVMMYDYVVNGAGAAGCVLTRRLVDAGHSVCLVEAAPLRMNNAMINDPGGFTTMWEGPHDWAVRTVPQPGMAGRSITINQGKAFGGGGAINAMMYVRCNHRDYALLSERSGGVWTQADFDAAFAGLENYIDGPATGRNAGGLMTVQDCPDPASLSPEFQQAAAELGYRTAHDYNGPEQMNGAGPLQFNILPDGTRHSPFRAYLQPVLGSPLLRIMDRTEVERVLFEGTRAVGVAVRDGADASGVVHARHDVILALGALHTPALLLRSGVGPAAELAAAQIDVVADLPTVGKNLKDHVQLPVIFRLLKDLPNPTLLTGNVMFVDVNGQGEPGAPDLQLNFTPAAPKPLMRFLPPLGGAVLIFLPILIQPRSTGSVSMQPDGTVTTDPAYLSDPADVVALRKGVDLARKMARSQAFSGLAGDELGPGGADEEGYIRGASSTLWHPAGTASMGPDAASSVVGADLSVHGITGLRVCDASVMPRTNTGNNHVPTMIIAEVGARKIMASAQQ